MNIISIADAKAMLNQKVSAVGTSGLGDGVTVEGILTQVRPYPIVMVTKKNNHKQPYSVSQNTLKLITK